MILVPMMYEVSLSEAVGKMVGRPGSLTELLGGGVNGISMVVDEDSEVVWDDGEVGRVSEIVPLVGIGGVRVGRASELVEETLDGGSSEVGMPVDVDDTSVGVLVPLVG